MHAVPATVASPRRSRPGFWLAFLALATGLSGVALTLVSLPDPAAAFDDEMATYEKWERTAQILQVVSHIPGLLTTLCFGWYLLGFRAARPVGMALMWVGFGIGAFLLANGFGDLAFSARAPRWTDHITTTEGGSEFAQGLQDALNFVFLGILLVLLPLVYPDGRLTAVWLRRSYQATVGAFIFATAWCLLIYSGLLHINADGHAEFAATVIVGIDSKPIGENSPVWLFLEIAILSSICIMPLSALAALTYRWYTGSPIVRRQIAVFLLAVLTSLGLASLGLWAPYYPDGGERWTVGSVALALLPGSGPMLVVLSIAVAVLRYSLYDIRVVVRRAAVYATLTAALTGVFVAVYTLVSLTARESPSAGAEWFAAVAAVAVVLCVEPARRRLQRRLERRFLGDRGEPLRAMARLRERVLEGDEKSVFLGLVETVAGAVRSPSVTLGLQRGQQLQMVASTGGPDPDPVVIPLVHRGERLGEFQVSHRTPGEGYGRADQALLDQLADQAAAHLYGLRRDAELSTVRQQALTATITERSRLGRDLHDGLAPLIAGAGLAAEALRRGMVPGSQDEQDAGILAQRLRTAAGELRRVAHDLQPGPLAQQGLAGALQDYIASLTGPEVPTIDLRVPPERLPPAVELVVYRVVLEAVANVVRHAQAGSSTVVVELSEEQVTVEVRDDGTGLQQPYISGVGIASMRSRIEALGGELHLQARPEGGTVLRARLPLGA